MRGEGTAETGGISPRETYMHFGANSSHFMETRGDSAASLLDGCRAHDNECPEHRTASGMAPILGASRPDWFAQSEEGETNELQRRSAPA